MACTNGCAVRSTSVRNCGASALRPVSQIIEPFILQGFGRDGIRPLPASAIGQKIVQLCACPVVVIPDPVETPFTGSSGAPKPRNQIAEDVTLRVLVERESILKFGEQSGRASCSETTPRQATYQHSAAAPVEGNARA